MEFKTQAEADAYNLAKARSYLEDLGTAKTRDGLLIIICVTVRFLMTSYINKLEEKIKGR